uniref:Nck-associated protein 1 n=1 Tax=Globodera rostochiensis TaxID=31243 RepID=A0A914I6G8_GLORO
MRSRSLGPSNMTYKIGSDPVQLKFAEKLAILNDRTCGMLTRFYNMKKACADPKSRPQFLNDKSLDAAISSIVKRFPVIDIKRNSAAFSCVNEMKGDILKKLSLYYYSFADLLDLKDAILQLFTAMDANQCKLNIVVYFDLTTNFLNLFVNFISLMVLLSRLEDRKAVLGLYNAAYDLMHACNEPSFPRLGQMVLDYDQPMRKLSEDLGLSYRLVGAALDSLREIYFKRNISAEQQRDAALLSLVAHPKQMLYATQTGTIACEYLSLDTMDRWIIFGLSFCHRLFTDPAQSASLVPLYQRSVQHCLALHLFRDECLIVQPIVQAVLEHIKQHQQLQHGAKQLLSELKDGLSGVHTLHAAGHLHAHRRHFLRMALRELCLLVADQPGLLGPKCLFVWMSLAYARDEVHWLLRHFDLWPQLMQAAFSSKKAMAKSGLANIVVDKFLPELLFYMSELRSLVLKHADIIAHYHAGYVAGYDAPLLAEQVRQLEGGAELSDYESLLLHSCVNALANVKDGLVDSRAVRLDWFRFQANTSVGRSAFKLHNHSGLAVAMNTAIFHLKQIDDLEEMLRETSDLSIYCFHTYLFDAHLRHALDFPVQSRFSIAFAHIATQFVNALHEMCPEERDSVIDRGLATCNSALEELAKKIIEVFGKLCTDKHQMALRTSPQSCARIIASIRQPTLDDAKDQQQSAKTVADEWMPGSESFRVAGQPVSAGDSNALYLAELCQAIGSAKEIHISRHIFVPREFLSQHLERHLNNSLVRHLRLSSSTTTLDGTTTTNVQESNSCHPRRPSEMLSFLNAQLSALQDLDTFLSYDIVRLFNDAMLQQSQREDAHGQETLAEIYSKWYLEVLLRRASTGHLLYSEHLQAFISGDQQPSTSGGTTTTLFADSYTDPRELRSLAQLIGPYGIKAMEERLVWHIASQITELFKLVRENREALHAARVNFDKPAKLRDIIAQLGGHTSGSLSNIGKDNNSRRAGHHHHHASATSLALSSASSSSNSTSSSAIESLLQRVIIIGEIIAFRDLLFAALNDVLRVRTPFLVRSLGSLIDSASDELQKINIGEACAASGFKLDVDLALVNACKQQANSNGLNDAEEHYNIACLLIVFIAIALPKLALSPNSFYRASLMVTKNNSHTIPLAVNTLIGALFFLHQRADTGERMREFLALASSGLLQIVHASEHQQMQGRHQSVYLLLDRLCCQSPWLNYGLLDTCFPYALIRAAYLNCCLKEEEAAGSAASATHHKTN